MNRLLLLCAIAFASCTAATKTAAPTRVEPTAADFYPLAVGTTWSYEVKLLGETRLIDVTTLRKNSDGFVEDSTGAQFLVDGFGVRDQKRYLLRNPIAAGTKWTNVVSVSSVEVYEITASNQPCDAPAGKWEGCVVVESRNRVEEGTTLVNEMTFAPGVGIVRLSTVLESNGKHIPQSTLALVKFKPPQG
ncbi:MAG: hypothetical protein Q8N23_21670 [Archangium sp.]|nr:hypothetical protein [Archangium sp.]MDP3570963.1 hypothetical protein [Archangium sp.]